jgi:cobalt-zinc-cadmium efflux system protein
VGHIHAHGGARHRGRLAAVLATSVAMLLVEVAGGLATGSLALLADAGHLLTDVAGLTLALLAIWFGARPATSERTYGYYRLEILAAVANAVLLLGVAAGILLEAWRRLAAPPPLRAGWMLAVALLGLAANATALYLLRGRGGQSLNVRGAQLEVLGDLLGSGAVVVAAAVVATTGARVADPLASALVALLILPRTWKLLREAVDVLLEAVPRHLDLREVRAHLSGTPGVADVHDLHAWTITSGLDVVSAHIVLAPGASPATVLDRLCACLAGHFDVEHSTLQLETADRRRLESMQHP